jgi:nucleoside-diphosphate kinase
VEETLIIIKPDGIEKRLVGEVIKRIENEELEIVDIKKTELTEKQIVKLYENSLNKFPQIREEVIKYMTKNPSIILIIRGDNAIKKGRGIRGLSDPSKSPIGSVRKDFAGDQNMEELTKDGKVTKNVMHASGDKEEVESEIKLFFGENEI